MERNLRLHSQSARQTHPAETRSELPAVQITSLSQTRILSPFKDAELLIPNRAYEVNATVPPARHFLNTSYLTWSCLHQ